MCLWAEVAFGEESSSPVIIRELYYLLFPLIYRTSPEKSC